MNLDSLLAPGQGFVRKALGRMWPRAKQSLLVSAHSMSIQTFLAQFHLPEVLSCLGQDRLQEAKAALLDHYRDRKHPTWPSFPSRVTYRGKSVVELSREERITQAEIIAQHRFVLGGLPEITLPNPIDWQNNPAPADPRWMRRLHRYEWLPVLAAAYTETRDERYAAVFARFIVDWITHNPPPPQKDEKNDAWTLMGVGLRCSTWIPVFAAFYPAVAFTDYAKILMLRSLYDHAQFLRLFHTENNHLLRESNGLFAIGSYFPEFKEAESWRKIALSRLEQALGEQVNEDGSHIEMSTGYQWLTVEELQGTAELLQANTLFLPERNFTCCLEKMYNLLAYVIRPDGTFPQLNDGLLEDKERLLGKLHAAGRTFHRDDFMYIGSQGKLGGYPPHVSIEFPDAGLYVMRSDWTSKAHYLLFDAGPYGGFHGHEDKLSIEVSAFGQPFIVDPGSYTYEPTDPFRDYFVGAQGHNTVLVDGKSQVRRWRRAHLQARRARGDYARWTSHSTFAYVSATYDDGYGFFKLKKPPEEMILTDVIHTRHILFVKPSYWVIVDELSASTSHVYQQLFHTAPEVVVKQVAPGKVVLERTEEAVSLVLAPAEPEKLRLSCLKGCEKPPQGWYAEAMDFYHKTPATTVMYERERDASTVFATLLYPCCSEPGGDDVSIRLLPVSGGQGTAYVVTTPYGVDYLLFSTDLNLRRFGPHEAHGIVAGIRTDLQGTVLSRFEWRPSALPR